MGQHLLTLIPILGRVLIGFYFVFFGIWNIYHWRPIIENMLKRNLPHPLFVLSIGITWQTVLGGMIICGMYVKLAALLLIPYTILSLLLFHAVWKQHGETRLFLITHTCVTVGALLVLMNSVSANASFLDLVM